MIKTWNKRNDKRFDNLGYSFFNGYLSEASVIDSRYVLESLLNKATGV